MGKVKITNNMGKVKITNKAFIETVLSKKQIEVGIVDFTGINIEDFKLIKQHQVAKAIITKASLYTDRQIELLLEKALPEVYIAPPLPLEFIDLWEGVLFDINIGAIKKAVVPVHIGNHWAAMVIKQNADTSYQIIYTDSGGKALSSRKNGIIIKNMLEILFPSLQNKVDNFIDLSFIKQQQKADCGAFTVDNLVKLTRENTNKSIQELETLLLKGNQAAQNLRKIHNGVLSLEPQIPKIDDEEQVVKVLKYAASLKKGSIAQCIIETQYDIGAIKSIKAIKDNYLSAMERGFDFANEFIRAINSNYTFNNEQVSKDCTKLFRINVHLKTKTSDGLLMTSEWKNLGVNEAKCANLLQQATCLGKAPMIEYFAKEAHSEDIESLQSIEVIKDAYIAALEKGFNYTYTRAFLAAIEQNYTFNEKVAQELAKLTQLNAKYKSNNPDDVLTNPDWVSFTLKIKEEKAFKLLEEATCLGKAPMIEYFAKEAHSEDIESLQSIEVIKDAYIAALERSE
ncbi:MAG: Ulp1 family isopeptidase, partial [Rickettsiaceae bacterium]